MYHYAWLIFRCFVEMGSCHVAQAGLKLLASSDPPASASQSTGIAGVSPRAWLSITFPRFILVAVCIRASFLFMVDDSFHAILRVRCLSCLRHTLAPFLLSSGMLASLVSPLLDLHLSLPLSPFPSACTIASSSLIHTHTHTRLNLTEKIKKIKIVFTPTICKQTCAHGHCANSCERGDTTTLYSQGGHGHDPKSGFRICECFSRSDGSQLALEDFCQIPCLNGGRCIGRDECWCPTNSTGKFCHLPVPQPDREPPGRGSRPRALLEAPLKQSTFTLPLSNQLASVNPSLVKVHIHHPPEASVQIHQVARVRGGAEEALEENSVETRPPPRPPASPGHSLWDSNSIPARSGEPPRPRPPTAPRPRGLLGRCYLNTVNGQCANPLLELTTQEDCCGSVGAFWGVTLCAPCPPRPVFCGRSISFVKGQELKGDEPLKLLYPTF
ncbi:Latent-transforming growth factor beta-binding protein 2 [Plecturocebus cupreus]